MVTLSSHLWLRIAVALAPEHQRVADQVHKSHLLKFLLPGCADLPHGGCAQCKALAACRFELDWQNLDVEREALEVDGCERQRAAKTQRLPEMRTMFKMMVTTKAIACSSVRAFSMRVRTRFHPPWNIIEAIKPVRLAFGIVDFDLWVEVLRPVKALKFVRWNVLDDWVTPIQATHKIGLKRHLLGVHIAHLVNSHGYLHVRKFTEPIILAKAWAVPWLACSRCLAPTWWLQGCPRTAAAAFGASNVG
mmetsp:Transcript_16541/g.32322  ORF Transcript_16541/g.32322 Transcript_16541/m.32322 type:complete len:248 (+) Transcript_16541:1529-2272(+)